MRILKSLTGWLSLICLLLAISSAAYWLYTAAQPWLRGAAIYHLPEPDVAAMARLFTKDRIDASDGGMLKELAGREVTPDYVHTGWDAFGNSWDHRIPVVPKPTSLIGAAILNEDGRVIAGYPAALVGEVFPFGHGLDHAAAVEDGQPAWEVSPSPYWSAAFSQTVARLAEEPVAGEVYVQRINNPRGETIALLAVAARDEVVIPDPMGNPRPDSLHGEAAYGYASILGLLLHWLLMIAWIAMDAAWRGTRPFAWGFLVSFTGLVGLAAYIAARLPAPGKCPNCGEQVFARFIRCPACGVSLMAQCPVCHARGKPGWQFCPVCGAAPRQASQPQTGPATQVSVPDDSGRVTLHILVLDGESGVPIPSARISVNGPSFREGITGANGAFEASRLRAGSYSVTAGKPGYDSAGADLELDEGASESAELKLKSQPGRIVGRVVEHATGRPMAGATVSLESSRMDRSALTGSEGGFVLDEIPGGPYTVRAEVDEFTPQVKLVEVPPGQQAALDFALDRTQGTGAEAGAEEEATDATQ